MKPMDLLRRLLDHRLAHQAGEMVIWQILSRGLAFFASAWAARCLGPEKLGISGMIVATTVQAGLFIVLNLDLLLTRRFKATNDATAREELITTVFTFRMVAGGVLGVAGVVVGLLWFPAPQWRLGILAALPMLLANGDPPGWLLMGQENMPANSRAGALQSLAIAVLYFLFFRPGQAAGSDIVVGAVGACVAFAVGWQAALGRLWPLPFRFRTLARAWPLISEGRWLSFSGIVIYIYCFADAPLIGYLYSLTELGTYRTALMAIGAVNQLLSFIPLLLFPRMLSWKNTGPNMLWRRQNKLALAATLIFVFLAGLNFGVIGWVYPKVFGPVFSRAAYPFAILLIARFVANIGQLYGLGLWAYGEDKKVFLLMAATAGISLLLNLLLIPRYGMWAAVLVNLLSELIIAIGCWWMAKLKHFLVTEEMGLSAPEMSRQLGI